MVSFFPTAYPDELLYSVIARYHIRAGNDNAKATLTDLFNTTTVTAVVEMPSNINRLLSNMPIGSNLNAKGIIYNHTMFPYFTAFLTKDRAEKIYDYMLSNNGSNIYSELGLSNSIIKLNKSLRFCPKCVDEDVEKYGETYWHRSHQIPGINFCLKHKSILYNSGIEIRLNSRQQYYNAMHEICIRDRKEELKEVDFKNIYGISIIDFKIIENIKEKSLRIGAMVIYLLNNKIEFKELNYFREFYIEKLIGKGLAARRNLIYQDDLLRDFRAFWGSNFLDIVHCNFDENKHSNWVSTITRKHRKGFNPIQHILFIEFLGIDIENIFNQNVEFINMTKEYKPTDGTLVTIKREQWELLSKKYPNFSKSALSNVNRYLYLWLYKYDNEWLKNNSPKKKINKNRAGIVDWNKRDEEVLKLVKVAVKELINTDEKPERITKTLISKRINKVSLIQKQLFRLPKTKGFIEENVETIEEFQLRRVRWAVKVLSEERELSIWDVVIKAGLGKKYYRELFDYVHGLINNTCL